MATILKANNTTALNLTGSWVGGVVPTATDIAQWDSTVTGVNTVALGGALSFLGLAITNPGGLVTIGTTTAALTLGASGISVSGTQNLTLNSPVSITLGANQSWTVASGRTLTMSSVAISGATKNLTLDGLGTKALSGASTAWTTSAVTVAGGLVTASATNSLGAASNTVTVNSGAALQISVAAPAQTVWSASGSGLSGTSYGAIWTSGAFGATRTITTKADGTVISIRNATVFTGKIALDTGITTVSLNGETTTPADTNNFTMTTQSDYVGTVTLTSLGLNGSTDTGTKYSIGTAASVTDSKTSGGGGLGDDANAIIIGTTGGIFSGSTSGTFNRNYTFTARGARQSFNQFRMSSSAGTTTLGGTLTLSGSNVSDYVQLGAGNAIASILKLNGTITGGANLDIGSNGSNGAVDGTLELGTALTSSGWTSTAGLSVNHIRYGSALANANPITFQQASPNNVDAVAAGITARHSAYANLTSPYSVSFAGTNDLTMTGPSAGSANWTTAPGTWTVSANTLTLGFNFVGTAGVLTKAGAGTLALSGTNTDVTGITWSAGNLTLNSNGSAGTTGATFTVSSTGTLDSTTGATLTQTGVNALNGNFTWGGSGDLTFGAGNITCNAGRTISFLSGKTGTLKFPGNLTTATANILSIGGSPGSSRSRLWLAGTNALTGATGTVTAGYFRVSNAGGLGAVGTTTAWTVSSGAAIEVDGTATMPSTKNATITGPGPNTDGALRSVSGTNVWSGAIIPPVQSLASPTRIQVDAGSFTLGTSLYVSISPTVSGTPLQFTALGATATLTNPRQLTANVSDVNVNNGGVGTVVFSVANLHTGAMTCEGGTTRVTQANATGSGAGNDVVVKAASTLESTVQSIFAAKLSLGTNGSGSRAILKFAA